MTQKQRVLRALERAGRRGITAVDFASPNVCDGRDPILRLSARVDELRRDGHRIERTGERRNRCPVFALMREAPASTLSGDVEPPTLVARHVGVAPPRSPLDPWDAER